MNIAEPILRTGPRAGQRDTTSGCERFGERLSYPLHRSSPLCFDNVDRFARRLKATETRKVLGEKQVTKPQQANPERVMR